ncbi:MAG: hypothetical protein PHG97_04605 [Candidatus Margulisbacteria bacterium]|nr:hypothetical protein [Candidatus Margulisiibacteriota bacterium]
MNKSFFGPLGFILIFTFLVIGSAVRAEVNVNINIGPPPIVVSEPPAVVMMPQSGIYFVPGYSFDVFFYNGYWWSPRGDRWYRAGQYNGPWGVVQRNYVPAPLFGVPKNYRAVYKNERPINYKQWKNNYGQSKKQGGQPTNQGNYEQSKKQGRSSEGRGGKH